LQQQIIQTAVFNKMKKILVFIISAIAIISCNNSTGPDVSGINVDLPIERFDRDFFSLDSNNLNKGLAELENKHQSMVPIFIENILGLGSFNADNPILIPGIKQYLAMNRPIYDSAALVFKNTDPIRKELEKAFRHVKYYFPQYPLSKIVTIVGPVDAMAELNGEYTPNFIGPDFIGISLQFYLGKNFSVYQNESFIVNVAPLYRSRRFEKEFITADIMKLVADDIFPDKSKGKVLIDQIIEKGKQWYLIDQFMPDAADSIKTGYTQQQLDWCNDNEGLIWNYLITNEDLYSINPVVLQNYIGESPYTQGMPDRSPGNIGPWIGLQIIKKFVSKNDKLELKEILNTDSRTILEEAKYKPK
jgi:hypothetical protein